MQVSLTQNAQSAIIYTNTLYNTHMMLYNKAIITTYNICNMYVRTFYITDPSNKETGLEYVCILNHNAMVHIYL